MLSSYQRIPWTINKWAKNKNNKKLSSLATDMTFFYISRASFFFQKSHSQSRKFLFCFCPTRDRRENSIFPVLISMFLWFIILNRLQMQLIGTLPKARSSTCLHSQKCLDNLCMTASSPYWQTWHNPPSLVRQPKPIACHSTSPKKQLGIKCSCWPGWALWEHRHFLRELQWKKDRRNLITFSTYTSEVIGQLSD